MPFCRNSERRINSTLNHEMNISSNENADGFPLRQHTQQVLMADGGALRRKLYTYVQHRRTEGLQYKFEATVPRDGLIKPL